MIPFTKLVLKMAKRPISKGTTAPIIASYLWRLGRWGNLEKRFRNMGIVEIETQSMKLRGGWDGKCPKGLPSLLNRPLFPLLIVGEPKRGRTFGRRNCSARAPFNRLPFRRLPFRRPQFSRLLFRRRLFRRLPFSRPAFSLLSFRRPFISPWRPSCFLFVFSL